MVRYEALREPMAARKQKLSDSLRLQQLFRDMEDEETWIREKEPIAASTNRGKTKRIQHQGLYITLYYKIQGHNQKYIVCFNLSVLHKL